MGIYMWFHKLVLLVVMGIYILVLLGLFLWIRRVFLVVVATITLYCIYCKFVQDFCLLGNMDIYPALMLVVLLAHQYVQENGSDREGTFLS